MNNIPIPGLLRALFSMTAINTILWCIWVKSHAHVDLASLALQVAPVSYYINSKKISWANLVTETARATKNLKKNSSFHLQIYLLELFQIYGVSV